MLEGKSIFIDWKSGLEPAIFVKYSTPSGDPLVHKASRPVFMPNYAGWGFFKFNPWRAKFDEQIRKHIEVSCNLEMLFLGFSIVQGVSKDATMFLTIPITLVLFL